MGCEHTKFTFVIDPSCKNTRIAERLGNAARWENVGKKMPPAIPLSPPLSHLLGRKILPPGIHIVVNGNPSLETFLGISSTSRVEIGPLTESGGHKFPLGVDVVNEYDLFLLTIGEISNGEEISFRIPLKGEITNLRQGGKPVENALVNNDGTIFFGYCPEEGEITFEIKNEKGQGLPVHLDPRMEQQIALEVLLPSLIQNDNISSITVIDPTGSASRISNSKIEYFPPDENTTFNEIFRILEKLDKNHRRNLSKKRIYNWPVVVINGIEGILSQPETISDDITIEDNHNALSRSSQLTRFIERIARLSYPIFIVSDLRNRPPYLSSETQKIYGGWALKHYALTIVIVWETGIVIGNDVLALRTVEKIKGPHNCDKPPKKSLLSLSLC